MLPLLLFDGFRNTVTPLLSSSQRICTLLPMSLKRRKRPTLLHAGPSSHRPPVHSRLMALFGWLKSRGGLLMTVGGVARCASTESPASAAPATAPIAFTMPRLEIWCVFMDAYF